MNKDGNQAMHTADNGAPTVVIFAPGDKLPASTAAARGTVDALEKAGVPAVLTRDPKEAAEAAAFVVVGEDPFAEFMADFQASFGPRVIGQRLSGGRPVLALGTAFAALFDAAIVDGREIPGCGEWPGTVGRVSASSTAITTYAAVTPAEGHRLAFLPDEARFAFTVTEAATGFALTDSEITQPPQVAWANIGAATIVAAVDNGPLCGCAFLPHDSGDAGIALLQRWAEGII